MGATTSDIPEIPEEETPTVSDIENLLTQYQTIISKLEEQNKIWVDKMDKDILDEKEQALLNSLRVILNLVTGEEEAFKNRLNSIINNDNPDTPDFKWKLRVINEDLKKSIEFVSLKVEFIVKRSSEVFQRNSRMGVLELHQKIHNDVLAPVIRVIECLGAIRKINEEAGSNNTGTKECEAIVKDWTMCNLSFGLAEITFYICALQLEWPDERWLPSFEELLEKIDKVKSVDWFFQVVKAVASGKKEKIRQFDKQIEDHQSVLRNLLPTFQNLLETLSGYNF